MSPAVVLQPRLTRMVDSASAGSTPMAASTWLVATLPEEQAAPAETATPARSRAMTCVAAAMPRRYGAGARAHETHETTE